MEILELGGSKLHPLRRNRRSFLLDRRVENCLRYNSAHGDEFSDVDYFLDLDLVFKINSFVDWFLKIYFKD